MATRAPMIDPVAFARELIDVPSVTGDEIAVGKLIEERLRQIGLATARQEVAEGRFNVLATGSDRVRVLLSTHLDTVPPFIPSSEDDVNVYGRGACDTKGIAAAMVAAAEKLLLDGVEDFGMLLVVGEETDSVGAKKAAAELDIGSEVFINGEPTGSKFVRATKGALTAVARFEGVAAHSAYPELGESAVGRMAEAIVAIHREDWGSDALLGRTTANVGVVRGGEKANVVAPWAECEMIFRIAGRPEDLRSRLDALLEAYHGTVVRSHGNAPVYLGVPEGEEGDVVGFNTDVPHLSRFGTPVLFGPGSILDAHSPAEKIAKKEILAAVETYRALVAGILSGSVTIRPSAKP